MGAEIKKKSFFSKIVDVLKTGGKIIAEGTKYFVNPMNWGHSSNRIGHEAKQAFNRAVGRPEEKYLSPIRLTEDSKNLGIQVRKLQDENGKEILGVVHITVPKVLIGDVFKLDDESNKLKIEEFNENSEYLKIRFDLGAEKIVIEIDVRKIIKGIKDDSKNVGKSEEEIRKLAIGEIIKEADKGVKGLASITGGEFEKYVDVGLLKGVGERLYKECASKSGQQSSESVVKNDQLSSEKLKVLQQPFTETIKQTKDKQQGKSSKEVTVVNGSPEDVEENMTNSLEMYHNGQVSTETLKVTGKNVEQQKKSIYTKNGKYIV